MTPYFIPAFTALRTRSLWVVALKQTKKYSNGLLTKKTHRRRHKNEKWLWHMSTNQHFPAYKCNIYRSASAQEMSSVCFRNMSLNIIKYKYSPETENKQQGSLLQASSGFGAEKKNAKRSTVHVYNKNPISQILHHVLLCGQGMRKMNTDQSGLLRGAKKKCSCYRVQIESSLWMKRCILSPPSITVTVYVALSSEDVTLLCD